MSEQVLAADARQIYEQQGYLLHRKPVFPPGKFGRLQELFEEIASRRGSKRMDELDTPHFSEPRLFEFLLADEVLDLV